MSSSPMRPAKRPPFCNTHRLLPLLALALSACSEDGAPATPAAGGTNGLAGQGSTASSDTDVCAAAWFCDDFEAPGTAPATPWSLTQNTGTVTLDGTHAFRGTQAALARTNMGTGYKSAMLNYANAEQLPGGANAVFGRMMFYLESAPETDVHWTIIAADGDIPGQDYSAVYRYGGQKRVPAGTDPFEGSQLMANYDTTDFYATPSVGPRTDCYQHAVGQVVPVGRWVCAEWHFDGANNAMQLWLDSEEFGAIRVDDRGPDCADPTKGDLCGCVGQGQDYEWTAPSFTRVSIGWESYQPDPERSMWIDDVVLGSARIGCPASP